MYTYLEIFTDAGLTAYYARFSIEAGYLHLKKPKGFTTDLAVSIPLSEVQQPLFDTYLGNARFSFSYLDTYYIFHEYSPGLADYIKQQLAAAS